MLYVDGEMALDDYRDKIEGWLLDLRRRGIASVLVLHAGRNGAIRGTSKREDAAFWILRLDEVNDSHETDGARFITRFDKNRNASKDPAPLDWHFQPHGTKKHPGTTYGISKDLWVALAVALYAHDTNDGTGGGIRTRLECETPGIKPPSAANQTSGSSSGEGIKPDDGTQD